jgi:hypothetical protein
MVQNDHVALERGSLLCLHGLQLLERYVAVIMAYSTVVHYATSRKVAGSRPDEVIFFFFPIYLILPAALGPQDYSTSNRNEHQNH